MPLLSFGCAWIFLLASVAFAEPVESISPSQTDSSGSPLMEAPPTLLTENVQFDVGSSGGTINFVSTLNGSKALTLIAGTVTFGGIVGGTQALAYLS